MGSVTRRRFVRDLAWGGLGLGLVPLLAACGQPRPEPSPARIGARSAQDATPGTPGTFIPPAPMPTRGPATLVTLPPYTPQPMPTRDPNDPVTFVFEGDYSSHVSAVVSFVPLVVEGRIVERFFPVWGTSDGQRPSREGMHNFGIFTPYLFSVDRFIKGSQPDPLLAVYGYGGVVGPDSYAIAPLPQHDLAVNTRLVAFIGQNTPPLAPMWQGRQTWRIFGFYIVLPSGIATNGVRDIPLRIRQPITFSSARRRGARV